MRHRFLTATLTALATTLLLAGTALAGGWANAIIDEPPPDPQNAGEPVTIGFTLLQHNVTPVDFGSPSVTFRNSSTGEEATVVAQQEGAVGHFVATFTFPSDGTWRYQVTHPDLEIGMQGYSPITVGATAPGTAAGSATGTATASQSMTSLLLASLLTLAVAAAFIVGQRRITRLRTATA
jgi:hypothetical protein